MFIVSPSITRSYVRWRPVDDPISVSGGNFLASFTSKEAKYAQWLKAISNVYGYNRGEISRRLK